MNLRIGMAVVGGILAAIFPLAALTTGWEAAQQAVLVGMLFRVGLLLLATALAWPQLQSLAKRVRGIFGWALLAVVLTLVLRPKLLPLAMLLATLVVVVHYGFRWGSVYFSQRER